jgi:hypothetical protein
MNDKKHIELIQAELDKELTGEQKAELDTLLDASADAKAARKEFRDLASLMDQITPRQPPETLGQNILAQIELPGRRRAVALPWAIPAAARVAMAFAAGIVVTIGLFQLAPVDIGPTDTRSLVGSMVNDQAPLPDELPLDRIEVGLDSLHGSVELHRNNNLLMLEFEFEAQGPVDLLMDFAGQGLQFEGFANQSVTPPGLQVSADSIGITASGDQSFVVFLAYIDDKNTGFEARIVLEFDLMGGQTHQSVLTDR